MRRFSLLLVLGAMVSGQSSQAQFNIRTDQGDVSIGSGGISVRQNGQKVNINHSGVNVHQPTQSVNINHSGVNVHQPTQRVRIHPASITTHVKTVSTVKTVSVKEPSLDQRVANLEIVAYGKKSAGTLISRVEKLETDTIGAVGAGSLTLRVSKLATALGARESFAQKVAVKSSSAYEARPSLQIGSSSSGSSVTSVNVQAGGAVQSGGVGKDIIFDTSGYEGTVACNGGNVVLNASACHIKFTGPINALVLNGSSNNITCDNVHHVQVNGSANDVNWIRSCNPSVANAGSANTLKSR